MTAYPGEFAEAERVSDTNLQTGAELSRQTSSIVSAVAVAADTDAVAPAASMRTHQLAAVAVVDVVTTTAAAPQQAPAELTRVAIVENHRLEAGVSAVVEESSRHAAVSPDLQPTAAAVNAAALLSREAAAQTTVIMPSSINLPAMAVLQQTSPAVPTEMAGDAEAMPPALNPAANVAALVQAMATFSSSREGLENHRLTVPQQDMSPLIAVGN
jgi:hypothetical protein